MKTIILATNNDNKLREIREMLSGGDINVMSLKEAGIRKRCGRDRTDVQRKCSYQSTGNMPDDQMNLFLQMIPDLKWSFWMEHRGFIQQDSWEKIHLTAKRTGQ